MHLEGRSSRVGGGFGVWIGVLGAEVSDRGPRRLGELNLNSFILKDRLGGACRYHLGCLHAPETCQDDIHLFK